MKNLFSLLNGLHRYIIAKRFCVFLILPKTRYKMAGWKKRGKWVTQVYNCLEFFRERNLQAGQQKAMIA
jgi:hypothetical protein